MRRSFADLNIIECLLIAVQDMVLCDISGWSLLGGYKVSPDDVVAVLIHC